MSEMPVPNSKPSTGIGLFVAAASLLLLDIILMFYIPVDQCMTSPSGTRRGRFVEEYLCSPTLLDDGLPGIARFLAMWAPLVILIYALIDGRRRRGTAA